MNPKKLGRPTEKAMPIRISVRVDKETLDKLDKYCKVNNIERSNAIRKAINQLIDQK